MMLKEDEVQEDMIAQSRILHFGTLSLTDEPVRSATKKALEYAAKHGVMVTFDPNLRPPLWNNLQEAKEQIWFGLSKCSAVKMSEEELEFITGERSLDRGVEAVRNRFDIPLICITMGKKGSRAYYGDHICVEKAGFVQEHTIETTGAGDTFCASMLNFILDHGLEDLTDVLKGTTSIALCQGDPVAAAKVVSEFSKKLEEMLTFANAAPSIITTRKGALRVMPTIEEVKALIS